MIVVGDCVAQMALMGEASVDAIVCDPPYGLEFMGKQWDRLIDKRPRTPKPRELGGGSAPHIQSRVSYEGGQQAQEWHHAWAVQALRVLKPGGHLVAFGGTRTYHRMVCAVEDAGFEIRDTLMWLYGQGFPKSHNLDGDWKGWGTALKPACEPIVLARKPLQGTVAANVSRFGVGALNVDGCRVPLVDDSDRAWCSVTHRQHATATVTMGGAQPGDEQPCLKPSGRWPANVLLDDEAAAILDQQSGIGKDGTAIHRNGPEIAEMRGRGAAWILPTVKDTDMGYGGSGGASRFFLRVDRDDEPRFMYSAKASSRERNQGLDAERSLLRETEGEPEGEGGTGALRDGGRGHRERNIHPTVKPISLMRWLCRLVTPPEGLILDPFAGSGSTLIAAHLEGFRSIGIELDPEYARIAEARLEWWQAQPQQTCL